MSTRIRYKHQGDGLYVGNTVDIIEYRYVPYYNVPAMTGHIGDPETGKENVLGPFKTVSAIKRAIKAELIRMGAKFDGEIRQTKKNKAAIKQALDGVNND